MPIGQWTLMGVQLQVVRTNNVYTHAIYGGKSLDLS